VVLQSIEDLAAALREMLVKDFAGLGTRRPITDDGDRFFAPVLGRSVSDDPRLLAEREACPHIVG
jgi:hypothetical protein